MFPFTLLCFCPHQHDDRKAVITPAPLDAMPSISVQKLRAERLLREQEAKQQQGQAMGIPAWATPSERAQRDSYKEWAMKQHK